MSDDTNVYVSPEKGSEKTSEAMLQELGDGAVLSEHRKLKGRTGRRKVAPLLGILQWASIRRVGAEPGALGELATVQVHVPSQILPKARF